MTRALEGGQEMTNQENLSVTASEFTQAYIQRELWGDKMSRARTKDEVLEFLRDNPESAEKLLDLVVDITWVAKAEDEEENDLPITPGEWYTGMAGTGITGHPESVYADRSKTGRIAHCEGANAEADAVAIAALPELLRSARECVQHWGEPVCVRDRYRRLKLALEAAGIYSGWRTSFANHGGNR